MREELVKYERHPLQRHAIHKTSSIKYHVTELKNLHKPDYNTHYYKYINYINFLRCKLRKINQWMKWDANLYKTHNLCGNIVVAYLK